jgi:hypothetical protein
MEGVVRFRTSMHSFQHKDLSVMKQAGLAGLSPLPGLLAFKPCGPGVTEPYRRTGPPGEEARQFTPPKAVEINPGVFPDDSAYSLSESVAISATISSLKL